VTYSLTKAGCDSQGVSSLVSVWNDGNRILLAAASYFEDIDLLVTCSDDVLIVSEEAQRSRNS